MRRTRAVSLVVVLAVVPLAFAVPLPRDAAPPAYFPLLRGHQWVYHTEGTEDVQDFQVSVSEAEERDGKTRAQLRYTYCTHLDDVDMLADATGVYLVEKSKSVKMLKYPLSAGSRWDSEIIGEGDPESQAVFRGFVEVQVPAGKFLAAEIRHTSKAHGDILTRTMWYAPQVGLIKQVFRSGEAQSTIVLKSFTPGPRN